MLDNDIVLVSIINSYLTTSKVSGAVHVDRNVNLIRNPFAIGVCIHVVIQPVRPGSYGRRLVGMYRPCYGFTWCNKSPLRTHFRQLSCLAFSG